MRQAMLFVASLLTAITLMSGAVSLCWAWDDCTVWVNDAMPYKNYSVMICPDADEKCREYADGFLCCPAIYFWQHASEIGQWERGDLVSPQIWTYSGNYIDVEVLPEGELFTVNRRILVDRIFTGKMEE